MRRWGGRLVAIVLFLGGARGLVLWNEDANFRQAVRSRLAAEPAYMVRWGDYVYQREELELAALDDLTGPLGGADRAPFDEPIEAIVDFSERLAERGVELWVVPVPARPWINAPVHRSTGALAPSTYGEPYHAFTGALQDRGVRTFDLLGPLQRRAGLYPRAWTRRMDAHWSDDAIVLTARHLAAAVERESWRDDLTPLASEHRWIWVERDLGIGPFAPAAAGRKELIRVRQVRAPGEKSGRSLPISHQDSPLLIFGDSHVHWYEGMGADIVRQLEHELGSEVDSLALTGGGASRVREEVIRRDWAEPGYLDGKKVAIWVFWTADLLASDWRITRLDRFPPSRLEAVGGPGPLASDTVWVDAGISLVPLDARWLPPGDREPGEARDAMWIRKPSGGTLMFDDAPRELLLDLETDGTHPQVVDLHVDGQLVDTLHLPPGSSLRERVRLPELTSGEHALELALRARDGANRPDWKVLGVRRMVATSTVNLFTERFDEVPEGSTGVRTSRRTWRTGAVATGEEASLELVTPRPADVLRLRWRARGPTQDVEVLVDGTPVASPLRVPDDLWSEVALPLEGVGEQFVLTLRSSGPGVYLDRLELDAETPGGPARP